MLYLGYTGDHAIDPEAPGPWIEIFTLGPGLVLIDSLHPRSPVYHAVKDLVPRDGPLLVAPLADTPKFKNLAPGALRWVRERQSQSDSAAASR